MECWKDGFGRMKSIFIKDGIDQIIKSDHHLLAIPNIPFFSPIRRLYEPEATIPLFQG